MKKLKLEELGRPQLEQFLEQQKFPLRFLLDNIRSALNVGSIFRSSDAFALQGIDLCGITAQPPHREILKTALGSTQSVAWRYWENSLEAVQAYKAAGYAIIAVEQAEGSLSFGQLTAFYDRATVFVLGNEVDGVGEEVLAHCDACLEIPQYGTKHSLNVAVCAGIVAWEWINRLDPSGGVPQGGGSPA